MSARAAVFDLLTGDPALNNLGITADTVWPAQAVDVPPRDGPFLILRWEEESVTFNMFGRAEVLTIWAHHSRESLRDFAPLVAILNRVTEVLTSAMHVEGADGTLTTVDYNGMSPDLNDEGYKTITKNAAYKVLSR